MSAGPVGLTLLNFDPCPQPQVSTRAYNPRKLNFTLLKFYEEIISNLYLII
jgi:hypothetical protein